MVVWPGSRFPFSLHLPQFWFLEPFPQLALVLRLQYVTMFYPLPLLPTQFLVGVSASPAGMEERWALGGQEQEPGEGALGGGSRDGLSPGPALVSLGRHQAWVRSRFGGIRSHSVPSPGDLGEMCLSYWLQVSEEVGCGPAGIKASSFLLLPACWNVSRLGIFTARIFPSQSNRFQLEPGDSSAWAGAATEGQGACWGTPTAPLLGPGPHSHPPWEMQTSVSPVGPAEPGLLELWSSGEAVGGLGDQKLPLSEERTWLAMSHKPHFLQPVSQEGEPPRIPSSGGAVGCQTQVLWPVGTYQPWQEVTLLALSPSSVPLSLGPIMPPGPGSLS